MGDEVSTANEKLALLNASAIDASYANRSQGSGFPGRANWNNTIEFDAYNGNLSGCVHGMDYRKARCCNSPLKISD